MRPPPPCDDAFAVRLVWPFIEAEAFSSEEEDGAAAEGLRSCSANASKQARKESSTAAAAALETTLSVSSVCVCFFSCLSTLTDRSYEACL